MQRSQLTLGSLIGIVVFLLLAGFAVTYNPWRTDPAIMKKASCLSNIRQQGTACLIYAADYDEILPRSEKWMDLAGANAKSDLLFHCPALARSDKSKFGYAMNISLNSRRTIDIDSPDLTVLILESAILDRNACSNLVGFPNPSRHKRNSIVLADGHGTAPTSLAKYR